MEDVVFQIKRGLWAGMRSFSVLFLVFASLLFFSFSFALADQEVQLTIKDNRFIPEEIKVKADTKIKLIIKNEDKTAEEFESAALRQEKIIRGGGSITLNIRPLKPGTYEFMGEFHPETARGRLIVE